jgi:membrane-bound serine protease (ClpP class)
MDSGNTINRCIYLFHEPGRLGFEEVAKIIPVKRERYDIINTEGEIKMPGIFSFVENIDILQAILLVVGMILLIIEAFIPSFGVVGIIGIVLLFLSIFLTAKTFLEGVIMFLILLAIAVLLLVIVVRIATKSRLSKKLINTDTFSEEQGYLGVEDMSAKVGLKGKAVTILRPAGKAVFEGEILDVVTKGEFVEEGKGVIIEQVEGNRIVVKEIKESV